VVCCGAIGNAKLKFCWNCRYIFGKSSWHLRYARSISSYEREKEPGEQQYLDMWGPAQLTGIGGKRWLFHILDGHTAGPWVEFLAHKSADETLQAFKVYQKEFETQTGKKVKRVRVDKGAEWWNEKWDTYFKDEGIVLEPTIGYSSAQNGPGERRFGPAEVFLAACIPGVGVPAMILPKVEDGWGDTVRGCAREEARCCSFAHL
jgi:hypothetical protein